MDDMRVPVTGYAYAAAPVVGEAHPFKLRKKTECDAFPLLAGGPRVAEPVFRETTGLIVAPGADHQSVVGGALHAVALRVRLEQRLVQLDLRLGRLVRAPPLGVEPAVGVGVAAAAARPVREPRRLDRLGIEAAAI